MKKKGLTRKQRIAQDVQIGDLVHYINHPDGRDAGGTGIVIGFAKESCNQKVCKVLWCKEESFILDVLIEFLEKVENDA